MTGAPSPPDQRFVTTPCATAVVRTAATTAMTVRRLACMVCPSLVSEPFRREASAGEALAALRSPRGETGVRSRLQLTPRPHRVGEDGPQQRRAQQRQPLA